MTEITPEDWSMRYRSSETPWDMGRPNPLLTDLLTDDPTLGGVGPGGVFVPGCGSGWDASAFLESGWDVTAVDMAAGAVEKARRIVPDAAVGDALTWDAQPFDVIFDHTFFCAVPPSDRPKFGEMADRLLQPEGRLVSIVFPIGRSLEEGGPPYGMVVDDVDNALGEEFTRVSTGEETIIGRRSWPHRLCIWERT